MNDAPETFRCVPWTYTFHNNAFVSVQTIEQLEVQPQCRCERHYVRTGRGEDFVTVYHDSTRTVLEPRTLDGWPEPDTAMVRLPCPHGTVYILGVYGDHCPVPEVPRG